MAQADEGGAAESSAPWHRDYGQPWQDGAASPRAPWRGDAADRWTSWPPSSSWAGGQAPRGDRSRGAGRDGRCGDQWCSEIKLDSAMASQGSSCAGFAHMDGPDRTQPITWMRGYST
eukprot:3740404-Pyramimonas_sp.AAC.1